MKLCKCALTVSLSLGLVCQVANAGQVSVGQSHVCMITDTGLKCEGLPNFPVLIPPSGIFTAVASGRDDACAIDAQGFVKCWGVNAQMLEPPRFLFRQISVGDKAACGILEPSQEIQCWGDGMYGLLIAPPGKWTKVSVGRKHACALKDTEVSCWGDLHVAPVALPDKISGSFTDVVAGNNVTCTASQVEIKCVGEINRTYPGDWIQVAYTKFTLGAPYHMLCGVNTSRSLECLEGLLRIAPADVREVAVGGNGDNMMGCVVLKTGLVRCYGFKAVPRISEYVGGYIVRYPYPSVGDDLSINVPYAVYKGVGYQFKLVYVNGVWLLSDVYKSE